MKINTYFHVYLNIAIIAFLVDILGFFIQLDYVYRFIPILILNVGVNLFLIIKRLIILDFEFKKKDLIFLSVTLILFLLYLPISDDTYDTKNYHIYLQEYNYENKVDYDLFPGKIINSFQFPLGDKMHYIFRYFLGYRAGKVLSFFSMIVIFYQIKKIFKIILKDKKYIPILAFYSFFMGVTLYFGMGTYYVDNLALPFLLEILYIFLSRKLFDNKVDLYKISLYSGIAIGIKITSIFFIISMLLVFMVKYKEKLKSMSLLNYLISIFIFLIPFIIYVVDNILQTGSPLFPYYNKIFKSSLFEEYNWREPRFGIPFILKFVWPIIVGLFKTGYGDNIYYTDPIIAIGFIVMIIIILKDSFAQKIKNVEFKELTIVSLIYTIFWIIFLQGYIRYGVVLCILYAVILIVFIIQSYNDSLKYWFSKKKVKVVLYSISIYFIFGYYTKAIILINGVKEYKYVFKDVEYTKIHIEGVWGVIADRSMDVVLARDRGTPIYNLSREYINEITEEKLEDRIKNNEIYMLIRDSEYEYQNYYIISNGYQLSNKIEEYTVEQLTYLPMNDRVGLYKVIKIEE